MANSWMILTSLHVALTVIALVTGVRVIAGMMLGHVTSEVVPTYLSTAIVVCLTSSQLPVEAPVGSVMMMLVCLLSVLTAIHSRYFAMMQGGYRTAYAIAVSSSVISLSVGAALQGLTALPELRTILPLVSHKAVVLSVAGLSVIATAFAVRGAWRDDSHELWMASPN